MRLEETLGTLFIGMLALSTGLAGSDKVDPDEIIKRFAAKEAEFKEVWQQYTYTQKMTVEVLDNYENVRERKDLVIEVYFTNDGQRRSRIVSEWGELRSVGMTDEDINDALHRQPFVLTTEELPYYDIEYEGQEWVDEINTYVFDVEPRDIEDGKRYFKGRIWVDDLDFQIVKTRGKIVPDYRDNKFPEFETIRQQVDGEYWFPVWTMADDHLTFGNFFNRRSVHIREWITYSDFQKFDVSTSVTFGSDVPESDPE